MQGWPIYINRFFRQKNQVIKIILIFAFFSLYYAVKHHIYIYSQDNETLICLLTFCSEEYKWKQQNYGGHVVYVIEQTDQFQKFGKNQARKYEFKKKFKNLI